MLNGIDPIMIFNFSKLAPDLQAAVSGIPIVSDIVNKIGLPPIPVYLSLALTGILVVDEEKNVDIQTSTETKTDGKTPKVDQKGASSTIRINLVANKNSIGVTLMSALADQIFSKVTSKEYSITYLHGAVTIFNGLLDSFAINSNADDDRYTMTFQLSRAGTEETPTEQKDPIPVVGRITGAVPL